MALTVPNVADEYEEITRKGGLLMNLARTEGLQQAAKRGLLHSSMAVGAAQDSMARTAVPLASQSADIKAKAFEAGEARRWQSEENEGQRTWQSEENEGQRTWQSGENQGQRTWQSGENRAQERANLHLALKDIEARRIEGNAQRSFQRQQSFEERSHTTRENRLTREAQADTAYHSRAHEQLMQSRELSLRGSQTAAELTQRSQTAFMESIARVEQAHAAEIQGINANTNMPASYRADMIKRADQRRVQQVAYLNSIYKSGTFAKIAF